MRCSDYSRRIGARMKETGFCPALWNFLGSSLRSCGLAPTRAARFWNRRKLDSTWKEPLIIQSQATTPKVDTRTRTRQPEYGCPIRSEKKAYTPVLQRILQSTKAKKIRTANDLSATQASTQRLNVLTLNVGNYERTFVYSGKGSGVTDSVLRGSIQNIPANVFCVQEADGVKHPTNIRPQHRGWTHRCRAVV